MSTSLNVDLLKRSSWDAGTDLVTNEAVFGLVLERTLSIFASRKHHAGKHFSWTFF